MSRLGSDVEGGQRGPQRLGRPHVRGAGLGSLATLRVSSVLRRPVQGLGHVEQSQRGVINRGLAVTVAYRLRTTRMPLSCRTSFVARLCGSPRVDDNEISSGLVVYW